MGPEWEHALTRILAPPPMTQKAQRSGADEGVSELLEEKSRKEKN